MNPQTQVIYDNLLRYLDTRCTLDRTIPIDVQCAEAASFILQKSGIQGIPPIGIAGTAALYDWVSKNPSFNRVQAPQAGALLISVTGTGNGTVEGHCGFFGVYGRMYKGDWGIVSNDSQTGLLLELWNWQKWQKYYQQQGQLTTGIFVAN